MNGCGDLFKGSKLIEADAGHPSGGVRVRASASFSWLHLACSHSGPPHWADLPPATTRLAKVRLDPATLVTRWNSFEIYHDFSRILSRSIFRGMLAVCYPQKLEIQTASQTSLRHPAQSGSVNGSVNGWCSIAMFDYQRPSFLLT